MINKLRKKFILIIMLCVMSTISIALGSLFMINYINYKKDVNDFLRHELRMNTGFEHLYNNEMSNPEDKQTKNNNLFSFADFDDRPKHFLPSVFITLNEDGTVADSRLNYMELSDEEIEALALEVFSSKKTNGKTSAYNLDYLSFNEGDRTYIVAADNNFEYDKIINLFILCTAIFIFSFFIFFTISLALSAWILKPVEKAWQQQNRFVSDASHELRTPITVILANLNILASKKEELIKTQYQWIDNTKEEAARMKQLIDELLFLARSDDKRSAPIFSEVNLSDILLSRLLSFEALAFEKGISFDYDVADNLKVSGHEGNIKQLLSILLDNAMKYCGEKGSVYLRAYTAKDKVLILVQNSGEPITKEDLGHIFERFYRSDKSRARTEGGYGLGLAIAKTIVESMKGKISVLSDKENGTVFKVEL